MAASAVSSAGGGSAAIAGASTSGGGGRSSAATAAGALSGRISGSATSGGAGRCNSGTTSVAVPRPVRPVWRPPRPRRQRHDFDGDFDELRRVDRRPDRRRQQQTGDERHMGERRHDGSRDTLGDAARRRARPALAVDQRRRIGLRRRPALRRRPRRLGGFQSCAQRQPAGVFQHYRPKAAPSEALKRRADIGLRPLERVSGRSQADSDRQEHLSSSLFMSQRRGRTPLSDRAEERASSSSGHRGAHAITIPKVRSHVAEHRRDQLGDRRVDGHGALERGVGRACVHHVEDAVDRLVAAGAEDRGAEDLVASRRRRRPS